MITEKQVFEVLQEINSRVPKSWRTGVVVQKSTTPIMQKVVDEALLSDSITPEKKKELQELKEAGYFSKQQFGEDPEIAKKINNFTTREINKAVKEGRLPSKKKLTELRELWKKQKETSSKS